MHLCLTRDYDGGPNRHSGRHGGDESRRRDGRWLELGDVRHNGSHPYLRGTRLPHCIGCEEGDESDARGERKERSVRCAKRARGLRRRCSAQSRFEPRPEIRRRLDRRKAPDQHEAATHDHVVMRALGTTPHMLPHFAFLERGASQIDKQRVLIPKLSAVHVSSHAGSGTPPRKVGSGLAHYGSRNRQITRLNNQHWRAGPRTASTMRRIRFSKNKAPLAMARGAFCCHKSIRLVRQFGSSSSWQECDGSSSSATD